jgi:hypothetical protein
MEKVRCAIERVDNPSIGLVRAFMASALLTEESIARAGAQQFFFQSLFRAAVRGGDEIRRALERYLQLLDLAEIAVERAGGFSRSLDHDVEKCGMEHGIAVSRAREVRRYSSLPGRREREANQSARRI